MSVLRHRLSLLIVVAAIGVAVGGACDEPDQEAQQAADASGDTDTADDEPTPDPPPECETWDDEPAGLLLTWQNDPTSTMTVDWHTEDETDGEPRTSLCFREAGDDEWTAEVDASQHDVPYLDRTIHRTELTDLDADTDYVFQVGHFERDYRFRTMPDDIDDDSITFATGGDTQHLKDMFVQTNEVAMDYEPDFVAWGGDLAYADGGDDELHEDRWEWWFDAIQTSLIDDDGRVVPILAGIGNHEVVDGYYYEHDDYEQTDEWRREHAPYYYAFFAFPGQPGYDVLDFGDYLTLIFLDSDHTNPVEGQQTEWLEGVLDERADRDVDHVFPVYHVAAFPSYRDFDGDIQTRIRDHWVPLFEDYDLELVFENHDHTYKRTHPIRDGEIDEDDGIVYLGDGAWGVLTREAESSDQWYIDEYSRDRHAIIVTLEGDDHHALMVDEYGEVIDEYGQAL